MKEKWMKHKKLFAFLAVLLVVAILVSIFTGNMKKKQEMMRAEMNQMQTAFLEKRTLVSSVSATGSVKSVESKEISVPLNNVEVEEVCVEVGDYVSEGDVVCIFQSEDIKQNLEDAKASLNATTGKTQVDVASAERNLTEAQTNSEIERKRADKNVSDAWEDYLESVTDKEEAEDEWNTAVDTRNEKKGEYEYRLELLQEAKTKMESAKALSGQSTSYENQFTDTKDALKTYVDSDSDIEANSGVMDRIYLTSPDLANLTAANNFTISNDSTGEKAQTIESYLDLLKSLQTGYQDSLSADAAYQKALSEYQALEQEVASWKTKYEAAEKSASSYESAYDQAKTTTDSRLDAYDDQLEKKEDTTRNNESSIASKTDNLSTARLNASVSGISDQQKVKDYEKQLEDCTVKATMSGIVTAVHVEAGDQYNGTAILTIEDTSSYEVTTEIDEYDIGKIKEGQSVVIKTNGTGDTELMGTVKEIAPRATTGGSEVTYCVIVSIDTPNDLLRMDMTAKLSILLESRENVLTVPYEALQENEDGTYYIEVLREGTDETSHVGAETEKITVTKGIESDYYIEVMGDNLMEGMTVVVPKTTGEEMTLQEMIRQQGPMGGF